MTTRVTARSSPPSSPTCRRTCAACPVEQLAACYKQLNSSVGEFGAYTLIASTNAVESATSGDVKYKFTNAALLGLERARDGLAGHLKTELDSAANDNTAIRDPRGQLLSCEAIIAAAKFLANATSN